LHQISGCDSPERRADVVFVHGLGGDAFATWRHGPDDSTSWPHWLGEELPEVGVWSLGYAASPSKWTRFRGWFSDRNRDSGHGMALPDRALQVLDLMVQRGFGRRPLVFIGHSLGGLVVKQILRSSSDAVEPKMRAVFDHTRAVLFLATPHAGAALPKLVDSFRTVFGPTVTLQGLKAHDAHLRNLLDWYRNHAPGAGIQTATYYEQRSLRGVTIVDPTSAHPGVGRDPVGLDEDHLSIAKPRDCEAHVCGAAREQVRGALQAPRPDPAVEVLPPPAAPAVPPPIVVQVSAAAPGGAASVRIPHELPPAAEEFFGRGEELKHLIERLRAGKNTAVVGPAGLGKTALAAEALRAVVGTTQAELAKGPYPDGVVYLDLYKFHGQADPAWQTLANALAGPEFLERRPARERATEACRGRSLLVVIEGGEEADGQEGRASWGELRSAFSPQNRWLLLTRVSTQARAAETVNVEEALDPEQAARLLESLTQGRVSGELRRRLLEQLEGHPLALTWAGNLLARGDEDPGRLVGEWTEADLPGLSDPRNAERTLEWLFDRSVRGLDPTAKSTLSAAALLARAPVPLAAIRAALGASERADGEPARAALRELVQRSLLRRSEEADRWQFTHVLGYGFARARAGADPEILERLGRWLADDLRSSMAGAPTEEGLLSLDRSLEHASALLRTDKGQRLWEVLAHPMLYEIRDRLTDLIRLISKEKAPERIILVCPTPDAGSKLKPVLAINPCAGA
jgi:hypothetical protein